MTREEAIQILRTRIVPTRNWQEIHEAIDMAIEALSADAVKVAYICDGRKCDKDCLECFRTLDIEHARDFKRMGGTYYHQKSADSVQGYTEWLEKIIVEAQMFEWLCEDATDEEWCKKNCNYASIQAECLRHLYEVKKGSCGERMEKCE